MVATPRAARTCRRESSPAISAGGMAPPVGAATEAAVTVGSAGVPGSLQRGAGDGGPDAGD